MKKIFRALKGTLSTLLYILSTAFWGLMTLVVFLLHLLIPFKKGRIAVNLSILQSIPGLFMTTNALIMKISTRGKVDISGTDTLSKKHWYAMICNHQSWIDILVLGCVFNKKIPPVKFFMKKELLWQLPIAGLACYALGYPFMSRHTHAQIRKNPKLKGKDIATAKKACERLKLYPTTLNNFLEGTRFTPEKKARQNSPFKHLLKPRAGGVAVVMNELNDVLSGVVNVVICYKPKKPSFWDFACGNFEKIVVRHELLPITPDLIGDYNNDRDFRTHLQQWLNEIWERNDNTIDSILTQ